MTDSLNFVAAVEGLPEQLAAAHDAAAGADFGGLPAAADIRNIAVLGMGGSGISGDVFTAAFEGELPVPVTTVRGYDAPAFVGEGTLAFAMSYSGSTEETLSAARQAVARGATLVAVSTGGAIAEIARDSGGVHLPCPTGYMPRAALGTLIAPLVVTAFKLGLAPSGHAQLVAAQQQLARRRDAVAPSVVGPKNEARELARKIDRTIPIVYGGDALGRVAALRWKLELNENAKAPAYSNAYPELDHNEICAWGQHGDVTRQIFTLVELRHGYEHAQTARRFDITRDIIAEALHQVLAVEAQGEGPLAQLLDLVY
ncbi:MAG: bifunctional phosphoglucose/phosphomannose isomerase, partial [Acidimicrobiia bacterium]